MAVHRGIGFPAQHNERGLLTYQTDRDLISQGVLQILGTNYGERVMLPEFGANLRPILWKLNDAQDEAKRLIAHRITDAIKRWEPRVRLRQVTFEEDLELVDQETVVVRLDLTIVATGEAVSIPYAIRKGLPK